MTLGELIAGLDDDETAVEALLSTGDLRLVSQVRAAADASGDSLGTYISQRVGAFVASAGSDDWMAVMTAASGSESPGGACLKRIIEFGGTFERVT